MYLPEYLLGVLIMYVMYHTTCLKKDLLSAFVSLRKTYSEPIRIAEKNHDARIVVVSFTIDITVPQIMNVPRRNITCGADKFKSNGGGIRSFLGIFRCVTTISRHITIIDIEYTRM